MLINILSEQKGAKKQALGRSRGGFTAKIHDVVDALKNPLKLVLTGDEALDIIPAADLLSGSSDCSVSLVFDVESRKIVAAIPSGRHRKNPRADDAPLYKECHRVLFQLNAAHSCHRRGYPRHKDPCARTKQLPYIAVSF